MLCGAVITFVPLIIAGLFAVFALRMNYLVACGLLAGSMTDPPALAFASALAKSNAASVGYATVYPVVMFLRVLSVQLFVLFLVS
jgi:putative transport protein